MQIIDKFIDLVSAQQILSLCNTNIIGLEAGSNYASNLHENEIIAKIVRQPQVIKLARDILDDKSGPLGFLSLTALTVQPGSKGMPAHIDYPHFHSNCPTQPLLCAQFVLSLDGTINDRAPTWLDNEKNIVELNPGSLLVFAGTRTHGVLTNMSTKPRTNLLWSIGPAWVRPMQKGLWNWKIDDISAANAIKGANNE